MRSSRGLLLVALVKSAAAQFNELNYVDTPDNHETQRVEGHYTLNNHNGESQDINLSPKGCAYEQLPQHYPLNGNDVSLNGEWNCTVRTGANGNRVAKCDLRCDVGYAIDSSHLIDPQTGLLGDDYKIKSRRLVCDRQPNPFDPDSQISVWAPAKNAGVVPRCVSVCGSLDFHATDNDSKAIMNCRNVGAIYEDQCVPGVNCHHGATCYPTCIAGFETAGSVRESNEITCECTQRECKWKMPSDLDQIGECQFKFGASNKRIIGGSDADRENPNLDSQLSCGTTITSNRKKRSADESLYEHRIAKRSAGRKTTWNHVCGGVLLTGTWAFTAAHCRTAGLKVLLGEYNLKKREGTEVPCRVSAQIRYPEYNGQTYHDVMMLNIRCKRLKLGNAIVPAKLPKPDSLVPVSAKCEVCGWGTMKYPDFLPADVLQCVDLPVLDSDTCNVAYNGAIHESIFCMGLLNIGGQDSCQGDSGGGAYCNGICYGLVMGGLYCADANYPGVYTKVSDYVVWAVKVIRAFLAKQKRYGGRHGRRRRSLNGHGGLNPAFIKNLHKSDSYRILH